MDIRTKVIFALVAVSLVSMFLLGAVVSPRVQGYLTEATRDQLDQLAEAREESVGWILEGWRDRTGLVASRTQLRASLAEYGTGETEAAVERIRTILADAIEATPSTTKLEVFDVAGRSVAVVERGVAMAAASSPPEGLPASAQDPSAVLYAGVTVPEGLPPQVTFFAPMAVENGPVGVLMAVFAAPELLELAANHRGLGETGETLVLARDPAGVARALHPTRHETEAHAPPATPAGMATLATRALDGPPGLLEGGIVDYRGEEVWAATRPLEEVGWGLAVKIDASEVRGPVTEFRNWLRETALILSAFAIVAGMALGLRFALPIHALAEVANRIREGEMDARAHPRGEDEVSLLARTFNDMADELEARMAQLHEFRKFFDVTIDLMCIAGTDGYFKLTNPAFERELGWSLDELLARPFYDLVHPDDLVKTEEEVAKLAEGIPTISFENRFRCKDGSYKLLRWTSYPEDGVLYAIAHVLDAAPAGGA